MEWEACFFAEHFLFQTCQYFDIIQQLQGVDVGKLTLELLEAGGNGNTFHCRKNVAVQRNNLHFDSFHTDVNLAKSNGLVGYTSANLLVGLVVSSVPGFYNSASETFDAKSSNDVSMEPSSMGCSIMGCYQVKGGSGMYA